MVKGIKSGRVTSTPDQNNPSERTKGMIHDNSSPEHTGLVLIFRVDQPEQAAALHGYRAAFGSATHIEALDENTYILHIYPGVCVCGDAA